MLLDEKRADVQGIGGVVKDGIVEGFYGYEAGQPAVGDIFGWFARIAGDGDFAALERDAARVPPGARGLLALDWWNGNRSVLVDANLSGVIVGLTLATTAAEIYRALIEATAFSTRRILDAFAGRGNRRRGADRRRRAGGEEPAAAPDLRGRDAAADLARGGAERVGARRGDAGRGRGGTGEGRTRVVRGRGARDGAAEGRARGAGAEGGGRVRRDVRGLAGAARPLRERDGSDEAAEEAEGDGSTLRASNIPSPPACGGRGSG